MALLSAMLMGSPMALTQQGALPQDSEEMDNYAKQMGFPDAEAMRAYYKRYTPSQLPKSSPQQQGSSALDQAVPVQYSDFLRSVLQSLRKL